MPSSSHTPVRLPRLAGFAILCGLVFGSSSALAQPAASTPTVNPAWRFDKLVLQDGTELSGFFQSINEKELDFLAVSRPPGRSMSATLRVIAPSEVERLDRLPNDIRTKMLDRFQRFKHRAAIEAGKMDDVALTRQLLDDQHCWHYEGQWFSLDSTADESSTRRCIVRIEQIFRAYRQLLAPRSRPPDTLAIHLYGSLDEYYTAVRRMGLEIENLAFYAAREDLIVTGAELSEYTAQLENIKATHQTEVVRVQRAYDRFRERLRLHSETLAERGFSKKQIKQEVALRTAAWNKEHEELLRKIKQTDRRNTAKFEQVTTRMFRRLYHEAFHAYLDRFVCATDNSTVDRWLNEGLAQVFESGQLEADTLRIDAPNAELLQRLQVDLGGEQPLALAQLLASDDQSFLTSHTSGSSDRHYLYAWGLAYYLAIDQGLLYDNRLEWYLDGGGTRSIARLEELTKQPLAHFEADWRRAMLQLRPHTRPSP